MISLAIPKLLYPVKNSRQQGVTLLLAILVLSAVLAIAFSLSTILFIEIRSSGDLLRTEAALYAATGIGEQSLFNLNRQVATSTCPGGNCYTTSFDNKVAIKGSPEVLATATPIFYDVVPGTAQFSNTTNKYDFCKSNASGGGCGYSRVRVDFMDTGNYQTAGNGLGAYLCEYDPAEPIYLSENPNYGSTQSYSSVPCSLVNARYCNPFNHVCVQSQPSGSADSYWLAPDTGQANCQANLDINSGAQITKYTTPCSWTINPDKQQMLIITGQGGDTPVYFRVETWDRNGNPSGLPYVGKSAININTINGSVGRKIQITAPTVH